MILLSLFGLGMLLLGSVMLVKPIVFANGIASFSEKSWFHLFEILSRLIIGILFIVFAEQSSRANVMYFLGGLLCFVSVFLVLVGSKKHRQFALLTSKLGTKFRPLGLIALICGLVLIYISFGSLPLIA